MGNQEHIARLLQGSGSWNRWRQNYPEIQPDLSYVDLSYVEIGMVNLRRADLRNATLDGSTLSGADLSSSNLNGVDLRNAELSETDLSKATLKRANLHHAFLRNALLRHTNLSSADLSEADLSGANLSKANLYDTKFIRTRLEGSDLSWALLANAVIAEVDFRNTTGLTTIRHLGPSHIELFSIQLPQDGNALHFLRSVGVPDELIVDYYARMIYPIQYHSCFISYSSKDGSLASRLYADLQNKGVRCWFAPHDIRIGDKIHQCIDQAIHLQDTFLLILSRHSVNSDWVEHEVETALAKERREKRTILFPIRIDNAILERPYTGWAATVQNERHIGDFTGWKDHDRYQTAFDRLIRDLKKADEEHA